MNTSAKNATLNTTEAAPAKTYPGVGIALCLISAAVFYGGIYAKYFA